MARTTIPLLHTYTFTYTRQYKQTDNQVKSDYDEVLDLLNKLGKVESYEFGFGDISKRLHMHGIVTMKKCFSYPRYLNLKDFNYKLVAMYNKAGWLDYLQKNAKECEDWQFHTYCLNWEKAQEEEVRHMTPLQDAGSEDSCIENQPPYLSKKLF
jgi:hypothetical protein